MTDMLAAARKYASEGLAVTPLNGKVPVLPEWQKQPFPSDEELQKWFGNGSAYNVGVRTGQASCLLALDIDGPEGRAVFEQTVFPAALKEKFAGTRMTITGSGNYHVLMRFNPNDFPDGIDTVRLWGKVGVKGEILLQGNNRQVVSPPSVHPETKGVYRSNEKPLLEVSKEEYLQLLAAFGKQPRKDDLQPDVQKQNTAEDSPLSVEKMQLLLALVRPYYIEGKRDAWVFHLSGTMRKDGQIPSANARSFFKMLANATGDKELDARLAASDNTYKQPMEKINGKSGLRELMTAGLEGKELKKSVKDYLKIIEVLRPEEEPIQLTDELTKEVSLSEIADILSTSIKRDDSSKKITFLSMLLAQTNASQINIGFQAESSAGKSYLPIELSNYFPESEVSLIASASPTAFFHDRGEWNAETGILKVILEGKILVFLDMPGYQLLERLRPLLSHDRKILHYKITDRSQKAGLRTKNVQVVGYPCVIFCSAKLDADEQERTRMILLSPTVDKDKLQDSIRLASLKNSDPEKYRKTIEDDTNRKWLIDRIRAIRQSKIREVKIPNHETLVLERFLKEHEHLKARHQRDFPRIINLIKGHAMLNAFNRKRVGDTIEASDTDINAGFELYAEIQASNDLGLSPYVHKIYMDVINPYLSEQTGLSTKEIQRCYYSFFHKSMSSNALSDVLSQLEAANLVDLEKDPQDKRRILAFRPPK